MPGKFDRATAGICTTAVLNTMGLGLIMPVTPDLLAGFQGGSMAGAAAIGGYLSLVFAAIQFAFSPILGPFAKRIGNLNAAVLGLSLGVAGFLILVWLQSGLLALILLPILSFRAIVGIAIVGESSVRVEPDRQGELQGTLASLGALASLISFPMMTQLFAPQLSGDAPATTRHSGAPFCLPPLWRGELCCCSLRPTDQGLPQLLIQQMQIAKDASIGARHHHVEETGNCRMNKSQKFWDQAAGNYDNTEEKFEFIHRRSREIAKKYLRDTDVVLDYGCGTGTTACEISGLVKRVRAIDISTAMIEIAKGKAAAGNVVNVDFEQADIFDEQFEGASFDVVLAFNMLHTVPDAKKVVQRTFELLRPGGTFISVTPCLGGKKSTLVTLQIWLVRVLLKVGVIPVPIRQLKSADLDALVSDDRFDVINTEEIFKGASSYFMVARKAT